MNPVLAAQLRRQWQAVAAAFLAMIFFVGHFAVFQPVQRRYQAAIKQAGEMGLAPDPDQAPRLMPARVYALLADNALPSAVADEQGSSGELTAQLLDEVTRMASKHGMDVMATEPGVTARLPRGVQVRAHLRVSCSYREFVGFLDDLSRSGRLISVDRFSLQSGGSGRQALDLWLTRYVLKRPGKRP